MKKNLMIKCITLCVAVVAFGLLPQAHAAPLALTDAELKAVLEQRIDEEKMGVGLVVGVIDDTGIRVISHGAADLRSGRGVDRNAIFEIGSITKIFTSVILADMVRKGEVKLDDPVALYLPKLVKVPARNGRQITLQDLATHRSGLPRMPANFTPKNPRNPYADYTVDQLYDLLSTYELKRDIGSAGEYSNLGVGLLGHVLALRAGMGYEQLLRERVLAPLGMRDTAIALSPSMAAKLAIPYNVPNTPVSNWDIPTLAGAGAVRSSVGDMLKFLAAALDTSHGALAPTMAIALAQPLRLSWSSTSRYGSEITHKDGGTGGYQSFIGFDPVQKKGVVVLSNANIDVVDIGHQVMNREFQLFQLVPPRAFVADLDKQGYEHAARLYEEYKQKDARFHLREEILNEWGYAKLAEGRPQDGIALLKLGVRLRPQSANTYDSLAEAYDKSGNKPLALENYRRVLELDPSNDHAAARIKALGAPGPAGTL